MPDLYSPVVEQSYLRPAVAKSETFPRSYTSQTSSAYLVSGQQSFSAIYISSNTLALSIFHVSGTQAAVGPTNQWAALYDRNLTLLAVSADDTSNAWAAFSGKNFVFPTPFRTNYDGLYYCGLMVTAGTVPTLVTSNMIGNINLALSPPAVNGRDTVNTGLTTPATAPNPAAPFNAAGLGVWAYAQIR